MSQEDGESIGPDFNVAYEELVATDEAWHKLLVEMYGKRAGDARYDKRGRATPKLRELAERYTTQGEAYFAAVREYRRIKNS
jgi:hypothetical protein